MSVLVKMNLRIARIVY